MPSKSEWYDTVEAAYVEISPRDDPKRITVHNVEIIDDNTCTALVNPTGGAGWVDGLESVKVDGDIVSLNEIETTGIGEQRVKVSIGI